MSWVAALVDGLTQSQKTWKAFQLLADVNQNKELSLVLFITQANCTTSAFQIIQRAKLDTKLSEQYGNNIIRSKEALAHISKDGGNNSLMVVDYWNTKNTQVMLTILREKSWKRIIVVFDEADQGGTKGTISRLEFCKMVEDSIERHVEDFKIVFITATIANLSKSILKASSVLKLPATSVISKIVNEPVVYNTTVRPHENYVGPTDMESYWRPLVLPKIEKSMSKHEYEAVRLASICESISSLNDHERLLSLIVVATQCQSHESIGIRLLDFYNLCVILNSENDSKNYKIIYKSDATGIREWKIPYTQIEKIADKGGLEFFGGFETGIRCKNDLVLPHVLCAVLFMGTTEESRVLQNCTDDSYRAKLHVISNVVSQLGRKFRRPLDWPSDQPRVAVIAGHIAGRGITIQNPMVDFVMTSFVMTDTNDKDQRGAMNAQRLGRACGLLRHVYKEPILLCTKELLEAAIANENTIQKKTEDKIVVLKDLVDKKVWASAKRIALTITNKKLPTVNYNQSLDQDTDAKCTRFSKAHITKVILDLLASSPSKSMKLCDIRDHNEKVYKYLQRQNRRTLTHMAEEGLIKNVDGYWTLIE